MKNLKFRVYFPLQKRFLKPDEYYIKGDGKVHCKFLTYDDNEAYQSSFVVQLWTGARDANYRDVYEGDILELNWMGVVGKASVDYSYNSFLLSNKNACVIQDSYFNMVHGKVIGNILENPELFN